MVGQAALTSEVAPLDFLALWKLLRLLLTMLTPG